MFQVKGDTAGEKFFAFITNETNYRNISEMGYFDVNTFLRPIVPIRGRFSGNFTSDLTSADDVALSFLSLLLLLLIEGFVATVLLRSRNGRISNFGFAVKHTIDLLRDFNVRRVFSHSNDPYERPRRRINRKLLFTALSVLVLTVAADTLVLFLTSLRLKEVTNEHATIRIMQPVLPKWDKVYHHFRGSWNRPCRHGGLDLVNEKDTAIIVCIETDKDVETPQLFESVLTNVKAVITSWFHCYGADHEFTINNDSTKFRTRAYFRLADGRQRLMPSMTGLTKETEIADAVHKLVVAYICSAYLRETRNENMSLKTINELSIDFRPLEKEIVNVLPGNSLREEARVYETVVIGVLPTGLAAFHVARNVFGGAAALKVVEGDTRDFFLDTLQLEERRAVIWAETIRLVNWLSITIALLISGLILIMLRLLLKPASTAEIAGYFVKSEVGALLHRSPVEMAEQELEFFHMESEEPRMVEEEGFYYAKRERALTTYSQGSDYSRGDSSELEE